MKIEPYLEQMGLLVQSPRFSSSGTGAVITTVFTYVYANCLGTMLLVTKVIPELRSPCPVSSNGIQARILDPHLILCCPQDEDVDHYTFIYNTDGNLVVARVLQMVG